MNAQIEEVSIDLWQGYKNLITELMPNAQVVADRFHVMTQVNKELDIQRKREKRKIEELIKKTKLASKKAEYKQVLSGLKNSKYPLLKNEENLNEEQVNKLVEVKKVSLVLKEMHELRDLQVINYPTVGVALPSDTAIRLGFTRN